MATKEDAADFAAGQIIADLTGRKGLRHEWDNIDDDIRDEIHAEWKSIILQAMGTLKDSADGDSNG